MTSFSMVVFNRRALDGAPRIRLMGRMLGAEMTRLTFLPLQPLDGCTVATIGLIERRVLAVLAAQMRS